MPLLHSIVTKIALALCLLSPIGGYAEEPVRVLITAAGKPWSHIDEQGQPQGISRVLIEEVFKAMEVPANYEGLLYTRALHSIKNGRADVMALSIGATQNLQPPPNTLVTPAPVGRVPLSVYKLTSRELTIQKPQDLANYNVGLVRVEKQPPGQASNVFYYPRNEYLFKALARGSIDVAIGALYFDHVWGEKFNVEVEPLFQIDTLNIYMAFSTQTLGSKAASLCRDYFLNNRKLVDSGVIEKLLISMEATDLIPMLKIDQDVKSPECVTEIKGKKS